MKLKVPAFSSKSLLISFLCAIAAVSLTVYIVGVQFHRSIYYNTLVTLGILSIIFFAFLTYGLYYGFTVKSTIGRAIKKVGFSTSGHSSPNAFDIDLPDFDLGDGIEGVIVGIVVWIGVAILTVVLLFLLEAIVWAGILIAIESLHWIFYRAIHLVLKQSQSTNGKLLKSIGLSTYYTAIYIGWTYAIVIAFYLLQGKFTN